MLTTQHRAFVDAARVSGNADLGIVFRHVLPNSLAPALVNASVTVGWSILGCERCGSRNRCSLTL